MSGDRGPVSSQFGLKLVDSMNPAHFDFLPDGGLAALFALFLLPVELFLVVMIVVSPDAHDNRPWALVGATLITPSWKITAWHTIADKKDVNLR